tara:strand:- start:107 stop:307 length:201 start_codon:yes stop_codon:yes gene_type:complete
MDCLTGCQATTNPWRIPMKTRTRITVLAFAGSKNELIVYLSSIVEKYGKDATAKTIINKEVESVKK